MVFLPDINPFRRVRDRAVFIHRDQDFCLPVICLSGQMRLHQSVYTCTLDLKHLLHPISDIIYIYNMLL